MITDSKWKEDLYAKCKATTQIITNVEKTSKSDKFPKIWHGGETIQPIPESNTNAQVIF